MLAWRWWRSIAGAGADIAWNDCQPSAVESKAFIKPGTLVKPGKAKGRAGQKNGAAGRQKSTAGDGGAESKKRREWEGTASPGKSRSPKKKRTSKQ